VDWREEVVDDIIPCEKSTDLGDLKETSNYIPLFAHNSTRDIGWLLL
jgi:hypothetical protein